MALTPKKSKAMLFKHGGKIIAMATSFSLEVNKETIDVTTLNDSDWQRIIAGMKSWSASVDGIVTRGTADAGESTYDDLMDSIINSDDPAEVIITSDVTGDKFYKGQAILSGLSSSASLNEVMTWSGSLSGDGALVSDIVPAPI